MDKAGYIVCISNPFGFGPAGKIIALMEELAKRWRKGKIVYIASKLCQEILPGKLRNKIIVETADERNGDVLKNLLAKYNNPFVICVLNKTAIKTAKSLGLKAYFIDSLSWMWKKIPEEYLLADTYYCFDLFDIRKKIPDKKNIKIIPPVFGKLPRSVANKKPYTLLHLGGFVNPYQKQIFRTYLNLLIDSLQNYTLNQLLIITGGKVAMQYIKERLKGDRIHLRTYGRNQFLQTLNRASHFITTSGLTATLEAFALKTPVSFIPPTNLSQYRILELLSNMGCAKTKMEWKDFVEVDTNFAGLNEKESIVKIHKLAKGIYRNPQSRDLFIIKFRQLLNGCPSKSDQYKIFSNFKGDGTKIIIDDLISQFKQTKKL